jgi:hypothetical protein
MEPNETSETSSILHCIFGGNTGTKRCKFKFLQIMIKAGMIQVMEIILLSRMTILMNVCIVSVDHALQVFFVFVYTGSSSYTCIPPCHADK